MAEDAAEAARADRQLAGAHAADDRRRSEEQAAIQRQLEEQVTAATKQLEIYKRMLAATQVKSTIICDQSRPRVNGIFLTRTNHAGISTECSMDVTHEPF
eukprot:8201556-Pyramimonas_sp.AAC.1